MSRWPTCVIVTAVLVYGLCRVLVSCTLNVRVINSTITYHLLVFDVFAPYVRPGVNEPGHGLYRTIHISGVEWLARENSYCHGFSAPNTCYSNTAHRLLKRIASTVANNGFFITRKRFKRELQTLFDTGEQMVFAKHLDI